MTLSSEKMFLILWWTAQLFAALNIILVLVWTGKYLGGFGWQDDPHHEFNYHPLLMVIGLVVLYGNGLLMYRTMSNRPKMFLKILHTAVLLVAFMFTVIALKTVFDSHDYRVIPVANMYSLHSWIGLGAVILFAMQFCCGFVAFFFPGIGNFSRRNYLSIHQFFGIIIFILSIISCHSGIAEKAKGSLGKTYQKLPPAAFVANFLGVSITAFAGLVLYLLTMPEFKRNPLPNENTSELELVDASMRL